MKAFKKSLMALAAVAALGSAGSANAYLTNWYLDTDGLGANAGVTLTTLDLSGSALITNTFTSATTFSFKEAGSFGSTTYDDFSGFLPSLLKAQFTGTGSGVVGSPGTLTFTGGGGALELFDSANVSIGKFVLVSGDALLAPGSLLPNGFVNLVFKATSLASDYFFQDATKSVDLADIVSSSGGLLFGFATTNAKPSSTPGSAIATNDPLYFKTFGEHFDPTSKNNLVLSNGGQFALQVPEPASLALIGLGLLGAGVARRRKVVAN